MGIRYYAYAFDADLTEQAVRAPHSILSPDPLADAWGMAPGARAGVATFVRMVPERDMLYLDKAWSSLQRLTAPAAGVTVARPAHRMFEGRVRMVGLGWQPWVRTLTPEEIPAIARDLASISDEEVQARFRAMAARTRAPDDEADYAGEFLRRAQEFVEGLAADGRGMVYLIG
jgi:hypothetical protein